MRMNKLEVLEDESEKENIDVFSYIFDSDRIKGLYCDSVIAINKDIDTTTEKACILAEELGHYHTTVGNILDQEDTSNRKQEYRARFWAYNHLIGLTGIIKAHERGCQNLYEISEFLEVTEEFLTEALKHYTDKYGTFTTVDNYIVYFQPNIGVMKIIG